ncbi:Galectin [Tyrophagus putrescentiae]|nr:Galectin [Tyrophagus putrescentiae]
MYDLPISMYVLNRSESHQLQGRQPYQSSYYQVQPPYNPAADPPSLAPTLPLAPKSPLTSMPPVANNYKITVQGRIKNRAKQFAIDIVSGKNILFHMNVRYGFPENITVFNSYTNSEWGPEERRNFRNLKKGKFFVITIESRGDLYLIEVNNDEKYTYLKRLPDGSTCELKISKVKNNDIDITSVVSESSSHYFSFKYA